MQAMSYERGSKAKLKNKTKLARTYNPERCPTASAFNGGCNWKERGSLSCRVFGSGYFLSFLFYSQLFIIKFKIKF